MASVDGCMDGCFGCMRVEICRVSRSQRLCDVEGRKSAEMTRGICAFGGLAYVKVARGSICVSFRL